MFMRILPKGEHHGVGGDGVFYACNIADFSERLIREYGGKIQLIFLDPPINTAGEFEFKTKSAARPYEAKYDRESFLSLMRTALQTCKSLLSPEGSVYIRVDPHKNGIIRALADEIFGEANFVNEIIWSYKTSGRAVRHFARKHDDILFYRKSKAFYFNIKAIGLSRDMGKRNHMKKRVDEKGKIFFSVRTGGREYRYFEDDPIYPDDVWDDIASITRRDPEHTGYAGQLPEALLKRIILVSSREGDIVLDLFSGSGTAAVAAARLKRKFVAADISPASLLASRKRLIELNKTPKWFGKPSPLKIEYSKMFANSTGEDPPPESFLKLAETGGECVAELPASRKPSCCYIAAGKIKENIFYAEDYILRPAAGAKLVIKPGDALQITDENCNQHFYLYSEE